MILEFVAGISCHSTTFRAAYATASQRSHNPVSTDTLSATDLPAARGPRSGLQTGKFTATPIEYVHIDISELRLTEGKLLNMFLAIDRISKFTCSDFCDDACKMKAVDFPRGVVAAFPYAIHKILTDNGTAFVNLPKNRGGPTRRYLGDSIVDRVCAENGIVHKLATPYHP